MLILPGIMANQRKLGRLQSLDVGPVPFSPYQARYFRVQYDPDPQDNIRLACIEIYTDTVGVDATTPSTSVSASSSNSGSYTPDRALNNASTSSSRGSSYWRPGTWDTEPWIEVDLGEVRDILGFYIMYTNQIYDNPGRIQISEDGVTYTDIIRMDDYDTWCFINRQFYENISAPRVASPIQYKFTAIYEGTQRLLAGLDLKADGVSLLPLGRYHSLVNRTINRDYDRYDVIFDPTPGNYWRIELYDGVLSLFMSDATVADEITLIAPNENTSLTLNDFRLERSEDGGSTWTTVLEVENETGWSANEERSYSIP